MGRQSLPTRWNVFQCKLRDVLISLKCILLLTFSCILNSKLLSALDAKLLRLTKQDDNIYALFRATFPDLKIDVLDVDLVKSDKSKEVGYCFVLALCFWLCAYFFVMKPLKRNGDHGVRPSEIRWKTTTWLLWFASILLMNTAKKTLALVIIINFLFCLGLLGILSLNDFG